MCMWPEPEEGDALAQEVALKGERTHVRHWQDFKKKWCSRGRVGWRQALHWLLKYRYRKNWSFENLEDYLVLSPQLLMRSAEEHGYFAVHIEALSLAFIRDLWFKDFQLEIDHPTHGLFVFKNRRFA
jgi:hypothetical protein